MRTLITGGPKTGKTTLAREIAAGRPVLHTDDLISYSSSFDESVEFVAQWIDHPGPWVIEGVQVARALRLWQACNEGKAWDELIYLTEPRAPYTLNGQEVMAKGIATVMSQVEWR